MIHSISLDSNHFHSSFNRDYQPILTINSGDTIQLKTIDIEWGYSTISGEERILYTSRENEEKLIHPIIGPIAIEGAKPGMVLEVRINKLIPGWYGRNWAGGLPAWQNDSLGITKSARLQLDWLLDAARMTGSCKVGDQEFRVGLSPFLGLMAVAPGEAGTYSTKPPNYFGGNIDCKELVAGSSLFLPISVESANFSLGDGHALQGDGEISGTAIECPMDLVDITLILHEDMHLSMPRANTPAGWITFGFNEDLNKAAAVALAEMVSFMEKFYGVTRTEAAALSSVAVNLHVTQVVNDVKGIHAVLPHGVLR